MEKIKEVLKLTTKNQVKWIILVVIISVVLAITGIIQIINYAKAKATLAKTGNNEQNVTSDSIIEQENLVTTSSMSAEELKKLNEQEMKKLEEEKKNEQNNTINTSMTQTKPVKNKYYIKVNYGAQTVTIYTYDKKGNYTVPVKACVCSTGAATPTSGVYRISWKAVWGKLFGNVWGHYSCQIVGDILFHSVPYNQARNDTLVSAYYDRLGTKDSMGCIRLTTIDAKWIYDNCLSGTQVEFYSSSNPGPLGKPSAQKVSNAPGKLKNWDPTDPDPKNPWKTYKPKDEKPNNTTNSTNTSKPNNTTNSTNSNNAINNTMTNNLNNNTQTNSTTNTQTNSTNNNVVNNTTSSENVQNNVINDTQTNLNNITENIQNNTTTSEGKNQNNNNNTNSTDKDEQTTKEIVTNNEL